MLRSKLIGAGYIHQSVGNVKSDINSVLIASTIPFETVLFEDGAMNFPGAVVIAGFQAFDIYGVYLPHKKKHNCFEAILSMLDSRDREAIIAGDYNTGINYVDQKGNSFMYSQFLGRFKDRGMLDAFRLIHEDKEEYSWFSHQGNGYRYDHTYVSEALKPLVKDCYYNQEARKDKLSDHAPMFLELA